VLVPEIVFDSDEEVRELVKRVLGPVGRGRLRRDGSNADGPTAKLRGASGRQAK